VLQPVALAHKSLADYTHIVGRPLVEEIRELAEPLKGKRVVHLSATAFGGGVSEILYTLVPLMRDVGIEAEWQIIIGREEFFNATCTTRCRATRRTSPRSSGRPGSSTTR
jgi:trehalose synthase